MPRLSGIAALLLAGFLLYSCGGESASEPPPPPAASTWEAIQSRILSPKCAAACHTAGTSFARQSDLVLTPDVAYEQLVNRTPNNQAANDDGLLLVGTKGLESLSTSFLWEKINAPNQSHFYDSHPFYGAIMPLGSDVLTNGELKLIEEWIVAGAPKEGLVADEALLEDETRFDLPPFAPLTPPANGVQFHLGPFTVAPNYEREVFSYAPLETTEDLLINEIEIVMSPGSHHFLVYTFSNSIPSRVIPEPNVLRDLRNENGEYIIDNILPMRYHRFTMGTQWPVMNYRFPPGVALRVPHLGGLDLNSHYANRSGEAMTGEIYLNIHYAEPALVEHVAEMMFLEDEDFVLPAFRRTTIKRSFPFFEERHIFQLFSHAHETMEEFRVYIGGGERDGELVYFAKDWEHPPILELDPPLVIGNAQGNEGLRVEVTYNNTTNRDLRFGLLSEDEMLILMGYYYVD
ncbi:MAG: hypothetical protein HKN21_13100 [Candidatus Eisenbacteria bacterium]|uniref:Copper type II ascorbate-dependent monooxygenase C-terminal domain-containing protein n=1 Tax=Eiseniibacteriota bacterium TaxID=2212470 RepID=A0A7Y2EGB1_UNCEI|nr:hypothetical protein [Candidatus Eisenbacteria bacterium]